MAQTSEATFAPWMFFDGTLPSGRSLCSMVSGRTDADVGQNVIVKAFDDEDGLIVDLYKDEWAWAEGATVWLLLHFDDGLPLEVEAAAYGHIVRVEVPTESVAVFLLAFRDGPFLEISFPDGEDESWVIPSDGIDPVLQDMVACMQDR